MEEYKREDIINFVNSIKWYQGGIELAENIATQSIDDDRKIFSLFGLSEKNIKGKRVLDIACNSGFYSFECIRLGASEVVGFDSSLDWITVAETIKKIKRISFDKLKFYYEDFVNVDWNKLGKFDIVFMNQCIYHIPKDPLLILDIISEICINKFICYTKIFTHFSIDAFELGDDWKGKYIPTYDMFTFELLRRKFNYFKYDALEKIMLEDVGIGLTSKERSILLQKCHKIAAVANRNWEER